MLARKSAAWLIARLGCGCFFLVEPFGFLIQSVRHVAQFNLRFAVMHIVGNTSRLSCADAELVGSIGRHVWRSY